MNLFIETPAMRARVEAGAGGGAGFSMPPRVGVFAPQDAPTHQTQQQTAPRTQEREASSDATGSLTAAGRRGADGSYSVAQEAYQAELAFDRRRRRRSKVWAAVRVAGLCIAVPLGFVALFLVAYALTCIMDGASPEELAEHFAVLFRWVGDAVARLGESLPL